MKKFKSVIAIVLALTMVFALCGCNKLPDIQKAFEAEGYELDNNSIIAAGLNKFVEIAAEVVAEEGETAEEVVKSYVFKSGLKFGLVIEFKNTEDLQKFYAESSESLKGFVKDMSETDFMNGNCILISVSSEMYDIFKNA